MQRLISPILCLACVAAAVPQAHAQADAQQAYQKAQAAYQADDFGAARDLAKTASQTDTNNAEVFLLLGKAHYQLGELDEAITAWQRTLKLAPEEPFAAKMLAALSGEAAEVDVRLRLIEVMIRERLHSSALAECGRLLADKAPSDAQRAKAMTLQAESLVRMHKGPDAQKVLRELLALYPQQADPVQVNLLLGEAKLQGDAKSVAEALALLNTLVADHPGTPAAVSAEYDIIRHEPGLRWKPTQWEPSRAEAMAKWLAAHGDHQWAQDGRRALLDAYLALSCRGSKPTAESDLNPFDVKALALASEIYGQSLPVSEADKLTGQLIAHVKARYMAGGAHAASVEAMERMLAAPLARANRLSVLTELASAKYIMAAKWLDETARAGKLPVGAARGQLPEKLTDVLATFKTIRAEFPAEPFWIDQANLAKRVRASASRVLPSAEFKGLKGPDAWALDIALPVVQVNADAAAVKSATETVLAIVQERAKLNKPGSRALAVGLSEELLQAVSADHPSWPVAITSYYTVVQNYAPYIFQENIKAGRADENSGISDLQKKYLATLKNHVSVDAGHAPHALTQVAEHVKPWVEHGHWAVAEEAYAAVVDALPEKERRQADLAVVGLWVQRVTREHQRLTAAGLTVPRQLDPTLEKALVRSYQLQAGLDKEPPILTQVRGVWDSIVGHYKALEYYDVAEAALRVKTDEPVEAADEYAALGLVWLKDENARRELARSLKQYGAAEKLTLGPEFKEAVDGFTKFIADRPTSPLASQAVQRIFGIGQLFQQHGANDVAAGVYSEFAKFAAGIPVLSESPPGGSSTAEQAAYAVAGALDAEARKALAKLIADRKSDDPPPAELSEEYVAAIGAYKTFVDDYADGPLVGDALGKIMAVALEYAKIDAWEVADGVYADLLAAEVPLRRGERLKFARGLCQLGRAMPEHARQILSALTTAGMRGSGEAEPVEMLAATVPTTGPSGGMQGGMEMGGMGFGGAGFGPAVRDSAADQPVAEPSLSLQGAPVAATPPPPPPQSPPGSRSGRESASAEAQRDSQLLAMIRQQESSRAAQIAQLRGSGNVYHSTVALNQSEQQTAAQNQQARRAPAGAVLSDAELKRQETAIDAAYGIFQGIRKEYPHTPTAQQARGEILVMVGHWRSLSQWERSAELALRLLADNPTDPQLPKLRLEVARDRLAWASKPIERTASKQEMLSEVAGRFEAAREELAKVVAEFPKERGYRQEAQWDIANSFLTQARAVNAFSPMLARGQYVRAGKEFRQVAVEYPDHPQIGNIPQSLWGISTELEGRGYDEDAIVLWNELTNHDPMHPLSQQAALKIAQTYHQKLQRPLLAAEAYQELFFAGGGTNQGLLDLIFQIGSELKNQKRYIEALHVLETFVDSFPKHPQAGQALTMAGQIHQTNEAWKDAIAAYRRVIDEFENGQFVQEAKWAIAECTINLSQWREAGDAYREYVKAFPQDAKVAEANRRIEVLKDLDRYQGLVDEENQRKAFDAQFQIATIVAGQLSNPVKAIIEYRKVVADWPKSHLADDALYAVGTTYLTLQETEKAREALLAVAEKYATSPLADDALFMVGTSFEEEATKLASATRDQTVALNKEVAQRKAYQMAQDNRFRQQELRSGRIADLKAAGKGQSAAAEEAAYAANYGQFNDANVRLFAQQALQEVETLTATQLADRQDKINAALRKAVEAYTSASEVAGADKADEALLQMATIYDQRLKDAQAAMQTWLEIVRQFSGTSVAEDASWRIAQTYEREARYAEAIEAYKAFLRNYRRSPKAGQAQFAVAENYEQLDEWVNAMDSYTNYINNFPKGPLEAKAKEQINWIKTYRL